MGVIFDEVLTRVEVVEEPAEVEPEQNGEQQSAYQMALSWQRQEETLRRRQNRLEAD